MGVLHITRLKRLAVLAAFALVLLGLWQISTYFFSPVYYEGIDIYADGSRLHNTEDLVYRRGDHMIEVNLLAELLGADIQQAGREFTLTLGSQELVLKQGSSGAVLNGQVYRMENAVIKKRGQVFVHARTTANALDWVVVHRGTDLCFYSPEYLTTHSL